MKKTIIVLLLSLVFALNVSARSEGINAGSLSIVDAEARVVVINHQRYKLMDNALVVMKSKPEVPVVLSTSIEGQSVQFDLWEPQNSAPLIKLMIIQD